MNEKAIKHLEELGLSNYEARAYIGLTSLGTANGYALAKKTGIPTAKIYQTLASLLEKGYILSNGMQKLSYQTVDPDTILNSIRDNFVTGIDFLQKELKKIKPENEYLKARIITNKEEMNQLIKKFILNTNKKLLITAWPRELDLYKDEIITLSSNSEVIILSYGKFEAGKAEIFRHRRSDLVAKEISGHIFLAVSDGKESLLIFFRKNNTECIWVESKGLTTIFADHILHDISLNYLMSILPDDHQEVFETKLTALRSRISF